MTPWLEIVMPVRNPGDKLRETTASLLAQTERGFGVVISDNFSTKGVEELDTAQRALEAGGVPVRRVKPPFELGRVQHWNWAHAQARADWLKPLFVGDLLRPQYVARVGERVRRRPECAIVRCEFEQRVNGAVTMVTGTPFAAESLTPVEFLDWFPAHGNWIGGPVNVAHRRSAFQAAGGYAVQLPVCADYHLNVMLALHHGIESISETLATFQLHEQRFSHGIVRRRVNGCFEIWLILRQARNYCESAGLPWPRLGVARGMARQVKVNYWYPGRKRVKRLLLGRT